MSSVRCHQSRFAPAGFLLAVLLLVAQIGAQAHGASYGFDDHSHDGVECSIAVLSQSLDDDNPETLTWSSLDGVSAEALALPSSVRVDTLALQLPATRAPPSQS